MAFQLSKRDENFYVLIHPDYPGFEVAANLSMFDNEEELKKGIVAQFCKDTSHEGYINLLENHVPFFTTRLEMMKSVIESYNLTPLD